MSLVLSHFVLCFHGLVSGNPSFYSTLRRAQLIITFKAIHSKMSEYWPEAEVKELERTFGFAEEEPTEDEDESEDDASFFSEKAFLKCRNGQKVPLRDLERFILSLSSPNQRSPLGFLQRCLVETERDFDDCLFGSPDQTVFTLRQPPRDSKKLKKSKDEALFERKGRFDRLLEQFQCLPSYWETSQCHHEGEAQGALNDEDQNGENQPREPYFEENIRRLSYFKQEELFDQLYPGRAEEIQEHQSFFQKALQEKYLIKASEVVQWLLKFLLVAPFILFISFY